MVVFGETPDAPSDLERAQALRGRAASRAPAGGSVAARDPPLPARHRAVGARRARVRRRAGARRASSRRRGTPIRRRRSCAATSSVIDPGPAIGRILELIDEERAAGTISTREEALELARALASGRGEQRERRAAARAPGAAKRRPRAASCAGCSGRSRATRRCSTRDAAPARSRSRSRRTWRRSSASTRASDYLEAARAAAPANVRFEEGDVMSLPFGYAEFDLVCCHRVLHHVRRPELAVSELARVARSGGKIFIADQLGSVDPLLSIEMDRFERLRDATHQRLLPDGDIRGYLDANDLVLLSSEVTREQRRSRGAARARRVRRGGAHPHPRAGARRIRTRSRSAGTSPASRAMQDQLVLRARAVAVAPDEPREDAGEERLEDRDRAVREPRHRHLLASPSRPPSRPPRATSSELEHEAAHAARFAGSCVG